MENFNEYTPPASPDVVTGDYKQVYLQRFYESKLKRTYSSLKNIFKNIKNIQSTKLVNIENSTKQFYKYSIFYSTKILQTLSNNIKYYTKQFYKYNTLVNVRKLQIFSLNYTNPASRQITLSNVRVGKLQKIVYTNKEEDKILWNIRTKDNSTKKYIYYISADVVGSPLKKIELQDSKEILNRHYVEGTKNLNLYGKIYIISSLIPGVSTHYFASTIGENPDLLPLIVFDNIGVNEVTASWPLEAAQEESCVSDLEEKQIFLQKTNLKDNRDIINYWDKRAVDTINSQYKYWQPIDISDTTTAFNAVPSSYEIISKNYKKQE